MEARKGKAGKEVEETSYRGWFWWVVVFVIGALVLTAGVLTLLPHLHFSKRGSSTHSGAIDKKYAGALQIALQFFDVQKSGKLVNNKIPWRGDSGLQDGKEEDLDLSKGMYDAGDHVKFGFPMAFSATVLSWAVLEYGERMSAIKQLGHAQDSLKWITDYLINAHPSPNVLYVQVGDPDVDHRCWERPETMTEKRPVFQINMSFPGTDVAAETAAALASASIVFKKTDPHYSDLLLEHAKELFAFADTFQGLYSVSITNVQKYYDSSGFGDELIWAAIWLYHATMQSSYLEYVTELYGKEFAAWESPTWFSWNDKHAGVQVLVTRLSIFGLKASLPEEIIDLQMYRKTAEAFVCELLPDSPTATLNRTASGLIWVSQWNTLQYSVASAFLAILFSDYMVASHTPTLYCHGKFYSATDLRNFAISQADYVLGNNPMEMSYLVGYGSDYPQRIHHRGSSIPLGATTNCSSGFMWLSSGSPNPNVAVGALVGGPFLNETYIDSRNNSMQGEPTTYNTALLVGLLSGLTSHSLVPKSFS